MANLLEVYNNMVKEAEEAQVAEEAVAEIAKYAEAADQLLAAEYGEDYNAEDVEKLASMMIEHDIAENEEAEKVAEWENAGRVMAQAFIEELNSEEK